MTREDIQRQAVALCDYMARGGSKERWLASKDFDPADAAAILRAILRRAG